MILHAIQSFAVIIVAFYIFLLFEISFEEIWT